MVDDSSSAINDNDEDKFASCYHPDPQNVAHDIRRGHRKEKIPVAVTNFSVEQSWEGVSVSAPVVSYLDTQLYYRVVRVLSYLDTPLYYRVILVYYLWTPFHYRMVILSQLWL